MELNWSFSTWKFPVTGPLVTSTSISTRHPVPDSIKVMDTSLTIGRLIEVGLEVGLGVLVDVVVGVMASGVVATGVFVLLGVPVLSIA